MDLSDGLLLFYFTLIVSLSAMANGRRISIVLFICLAMDASLAHSPPPISPMRHFNYVWDDLPDAPVYVASGNTILTRQESAERLASLRSVLEEYEISAYIVPTADAHNSAYIAPTDARREWISGLSGSSGTAVVTPSRALVWTDARYWTQFEMQVDMEIWELMRQGIDLSIQAWLVQNIAPGESVAVDPTTYTRSAWNTLQAALQAANIELVAIPNNLVDLARASIGDPAPPRPNKELVTLTVQFTGRPSNQKISELFTQISSRGATALILTALDDVAYTLNLRGSDIPYNPVFFAYLILRVDVAAPNNVVLFSGSGTLTPDVIQHLNSEGTQIEVRPYQEIFEYVTNMSNELPEGSIIWLSNDGSHAIHLAAEGDGTTNILSTLSPVALIKCVKNQVELAGFRSAHVKDGTAVVRFLRWLHDQVDAGEEVTEVDTSNKLEQLRGEEVHSMGPSFATIAGAGENGAVIHYKPSPDGPHRVITADDMFLVDSGGQYRDGTTDITRTRHMSSSPTPAQRLAFTRVLKGQIMMGAAVFPRGIVGHRLETLARKALWDVGLDYGHGTGHGVGHFLNVHEGPSWILSGPSPTDPGIVPGMIFSNEPGYYEVNEYGIRHEDLVEVIQMSADADHVLAEGLVGDFGGLGALGFYTISLAPHQTACLDIDLLTDFEIKYLNEYHARVLSTIGPILLERHLQEDYDWLERECAPIERSAAAILGKSTPFLALFTVVTVWIGV